MESPVGSPVDVGGAYVGPTQNALLQLAEEAGVRTYTVHKEGINVLDLDGHRATHLVESCSIDFYATGDYSLDGFAGLIGSEQFCPSH